MVVVQPPPGHSYPHAIVRDRINRLAFFHLVPGKVAGEHDLRRTLAGPKGSRTDTLLGGVRRLTFTADSDAALMIHLTLGDGERSYAFHTQIRLRNRDAAEGE
jgi:hypothetical protein